jgi:dTDP-glucose pyrophosphorylase
MIDIPGSSREDITVFVPAAGPVDEGIVALSNIASPAMIPVAGRPVIQWTLEYLRDLGLRHFLIGVRERGQFLEDFVDCVFADEINVQYVTPTDHRGPLSTICALAEQAVTGRALVVLGDTNFEFADPNVLDSQEPFVLVGHVDESYRWCIADTDSEGYAVDYHDKQPGLEPPLSALIGVYFFPDLNQLRQSAKQLLDGREGSGEISTLLCELGQSAPIRALRAARWLDCGNPDTQISSARTLLQERSFNHLEVDPVRGTIIKRSEHREKLIDEINYLRLLPDELQPLFPRVFGWSTEWREPWLEMEYYGYPTLAELFVFESVDPDVWRRVFEHLHAVVTRAFMTHERPIDPSDVRTMLFDKTLARLKALTAPDQLVDLVRREQVVVNGKTLLSLPSVQDIVLMHVDRIAETAVGHAIHGDLCFSNVLYDLRSNACKFIDPRGSFARPGIFGDIRYDIAKLWHSVHGLYDFITADLFRVDIAEQDVRMRIQTRRQHELIRRQFERVFAETFDLADVQLVTALIFLGLAPFHADAPTRQIAFYVRGLQLLDEWLVPETHE